MPQEKKKKQLGGGLSGKKIKIKLYLLRTTPKGGIKEKKLERGKNAPNRPTTTYARSVRGEINFTQGSGLPDERPRTSKFIEPVKLGDKVA